MRLLTALQAWAAVKRDQYDDHGTIIALGKLTVGFKL